MFIVDKIWIEYVLRKLFVGVYMQVVIYIYIYDLVFNLSIEVLSTLTKRLGLGG